MSLVADNEQTRRVPVHIAIIMDGNGRWAAERGLPRFMGHRAGTENLRPLIRACVEFGVKYLTLYAFSTENWARPSDEVAGLIKLLETVIDEELPELDQEGVQIRHIGRLDAFSPALVAKIQHAVRTTRKNDRLVLTVAFNYGGRDEILHAIQQIVKEGLAPEQITEEVISQYLFTSGIPDPDLIIRTSGEMRVSNFLIWQGVYAEWYVTPTFWPDFDKEALRKALEDYSQRTRRYGGLTPGDEGDKSNAG